MSFELPWFATHSALPLFERIFEATQVPAKLRQPHRFQQFAQYLESAIDSNFKLFGLETRLFLCGLSGKTLTSDMDRYVSYHDKNRFSEKRTKAQKLAEVAAGVVEKKPFVVTVENRANPYRHASSQRLHGAFRSVLLELAKMGHPVRKLKVEQGEAGWTEGHGYRGARHHATLSYITESGTTGSYEFNLHEVFKVERYLPKFEYLEILEGVAEAGLYLSTFDEGTNTFTLHPFVKCVLPENIVAVFKSKYQHRMERQEIDRRLAAGQEIKSMPNPGSPYDKYVLNPGRHNNSKQVTRLGSLERRLQVFSQYDQEMKATVERFLALLSAEDDIHQECAHRRLVYVYDAFKKERTRFWAVAKEVCYRTDIPKEIPARPRDGDKWPKLRMSAGIGEKSSYESHKRGFSLAWQALLDELAHYRLVTSRHADCEFRLYGPVAETMRNPVHGAQFYS